MVQIAVKLSGLLTVILCLKSFKKRNLSDLKDKVSLCLGFSSAKDVCKERKVSLYGRRRIEILHRDSKCFDLDES